MTSFIGRTVPSGDAMHAVPVFVINDDGAWMLKRPQDHPRADRRRAGTRRRCPDQTLLSAYHSSMEEAVLAFVEYKYATGRGTLRDGGEATAWKDPATVQAGIPAYSDESIAATIAHCDYLYRRYGRFPPGTGPFQTVLAYQAHGLDPDFYDRFYRSGTLAGL